MKLVAAVLLLAAAGAVAYTQQPPRPVVPDVPTLPDAGPLIPRPIPAVPVQAAPKEPTVEQLLDELEKVQAQKAALEKRERELIEAARKKLEQQGDRLKKLGVASVPPAGEPDRVGRVIIKGGDGENEKKILAAAKDLRPGQVLTYPAVAEAEKRLQKAGYPEARVTVEPNKDDSAFKDIVIWVGK